MTTQTEPQTEPNITLDRELTIAAQGRARMITKSALDAAKARAYRILRHTRISPPLPDSQP